MKQIKNSEYEEFQKYLHNKNNGRILTPDGVRLICQANDYDAAKIGQHFLEVLPKILQSEKWGTCMSGEKKTVSKEKDTYVKKKKDMNFQSVDSIRSLAAALRWLPVRKQTMCAGALSLTRSSWMSSWSGTS